MWYTKYDLGSQDVPRWTDFDYGKSEVAAIAPIRLNDHTYWAAVGPPSRVGLATVLTLGVASLLLGRGYILRLWANDPRRLPDSPSTFSPTQPEAWHLIIRSKNDLGGLIER